MNTLLVLAAVSGIVSADVGLGYQYKVPHTSYGVPSYTVGSSASSNYNTAYNGAGINHFKNQAGYQDANIGTQSQGVYSSFQSSGSGVGKEYYPNSAGSSSASAISNTLVRPNLQYSGSSGENSYQHYNNYQTSNNYQQKYQYQFQNLQPAQIFKHFYVHAAPEEPEVKVQPKTVVLPAPQKHYKIIFIKTPIQPVAPPQLIPIQPQTEEKTIVYVLVNKPHELQDVVVPKAEVRPPSKPEVYFIKYNNKEGSQGVINNIVNDYSNKEQPENYINYSGSSVNSFSVPQVATGTGSSSSGSYSEKSQVASGPIAGSQSESELLASLGAPFGKAPSGHGESHSSSHYDSAYVSGSSHVADLPSYPSKETASSSVAGYDHSASGSSSSTATVAGSGSAQTYQNIKPIPTSQGVPHESYGVPKFKAN